MKRVAEFRPVLLIWLAAPVLVWLALRGVSFQEVWAILQRIEGWQIFVLLWVNVAILLLFSGRWWLILRGMGYRLPYFRLAAYRIAGFGVSYFTPGPQLGGEPLQVALIGGRHGVPIPVAISSVYFDKIIELLANFTFLAVGVLLVFSSGILGGAILPALGLIALPLLFLPGLHLFALARQKSPVTGLLRWMNTRLDRRNRVWALTGVVQDAEEKMSQFMRQSPRTLQQILVLSLLTWLVVIAEYVLLLRFLGYDVSLVQGVVGLTAARVAFLLPLPGGIGALEAGQAAALTALGYSAAAGLSISLVIRARDIVIGVFGLWIGAATARSVWATPNLEPKEERK